MKRALIIRVLTLELGPLVAALAIAVYAKRLAPMAFVVAAILISISVILSIRDGAVVTRAGDVIDKQTRRIQFWLHIVGHASIAGVCVFGAIYTCVR